LSPRSILVFESTLAGRLDQGTARIAGLGYGAEPGSASGLSGNAYGIPTTNSLGRTLTMEEITASVGDLLRFARAHPDWNFRVTSLGQNLSPAERERLIEQFRAPPANCRLPGSWLAQFNRLPHQRLLIVGGAHSLSRAQTAADFTEFLRLNAPLWGSGTLEIVSCGSSGDTVTIDRYAKAHGLAHKVIPTDEARYGAHAGLARDELALWYCSRVVSLIRADETSPGNEVRLIATAARAGIPLEELYAD